MVYGCAPRRTAQISLTRRKPGVIGLALTGLAILLLLVSLTTHPPPSFITATVVVVVPHSPPRLCRFRIVIAFELRSCEAEPPGRCARGWCVRLDACGIHICTKRKGTKKNNAYGLCHSQLPSLYGMRSGVFLSKKCGHECGGRSKYEQKAVLAAAGRNGSCRALVVSSHPFHHNFLTSTMQARD